MTFTAVVPSIYPLWTDRCLASMSPEFLASTVVVDNTTDNLGVAASWNLGIEHMRRRDDDWVVIVSATMRFGAPGGMDFIEHLELETEAAAVEAGHGVGWHLIAFPRRTIAKVGLFDTIFWPGYMEDIDYSRRIWLANDQPGEPWWVKVPDLDLAMAGFAHGIDLGGAKPVHDQLMASYSRKWGGIKGDERFTIPYNDSACDLTFIGPHD